MSTLFTATIPAGCLPCCSPPACVSNTSTIHTVFSGVTFCIDVCFPLNTVFGKIHSITGGPDGTYDALPLMPSWEVDDIFETISADEYVFAGCGGSPFEPLTGMAYVVVTCEAGNYIVRGLIDVTNGAAQNATLQWFYGEGTMGTIANQLTACGQIIAGLNGIGYGGSVTISEIP